MRALKPWTVVARRLKPFLATLHAATPWHVENTTVLCWFRNQTWEDLNIGDHSCASLCREPAALPVVPCDPLRSYEDTVLESYRVRVAMQLAYRLLFVQFLATQLPPRFRTSIDWSGDFPHDAHLALVDAWRSDAADYWASAHGNRFGASSVG